MSQIAVTKKKKSKEIDLNPEKICLNCIHLKHSVKEVEKLKDTYPIFGASFKLVKDGCLLPLCTKYQMPLFDLEQSTCSDFNLNKVLAKQIREERERIAKIQADIEYEKRVREEMENELLETQQLVDKIKSDLNKKHLGKRKFLNDQIANVKQSIEERKTMYRNPLRIIRDAKTLQEETVKIEEAIKVDSELIERQKLLEQLESDLRKLTEGD